MRVADYIAARCVAAGLRDVFLVTGGGAMHLNDAFSRNRELRCLCFHHEQAAAIAAEGYCRTVNRPAVLNVTTGPGGINALNGVYGAFVDSIGMLVVSGQVKRETYARSYALPLRQLGDQEVDIVSMARSVTKYSTTLFDPSHVREVMDKALYLATSGRPGPVWIDVPVDVQGTVIDTCALAGFDGNLRSLAADRDVSDNTRRELLDLPPVPDEKAIEEIMQRLAQAKRPVIMAGTGVRVSGMHEQFLELVEKLGIPVVTGWNAHDLLASDHPCYAGRPGTVGDRPGNFTVQNADFLLVLGCRLNIRQISYNWQSFASHAWKAMVDVDSAELQKPTVNVDLKVHSRLQDFIPYLCSHLVSYQVPREHLKYLEWCLERVRKYPTLLPEYRQRDTPINPYVFIDDLFSMLDQDAVIVAGNGSACVIGFQAAKLKRGQRFFTNSGNASMGFDLPAAIGACIALEKRKVICLAGDGSLMMNLQELQTLVGCKLPVKVIILNNGGYHSILQTQRAYFADNLFGCGPENGVTFPDFIKLGEALGIASIRVSSLPEWSSDPVRALMSSFAPALIEVMLDPEQQFSPKLASRKDADGRMLTPSLEDMSPFLSREELSNNMFT
ncbi:MAG: thiamine pyrophosphate-binding protein [Betaproteobacteria bacterium]|nr:thiamine pyrophosphate-binding protein [Betaproteobacteria bacterium]